MKLREVKALYRSKDAVLSENDLDLQMAVVSEKVEELESAYIRMERKITDLAGSADQQTNELSLVDELSDKEGMKVGELSLVFYYLFNELKVNFSNSDKTQWARFIHRLTGKSYEHIRSTLVFDFNLKSTQKHLRNVASLFSELFPAIETKVLNDMEPLK